MRGHPLLGALNSSLWNASAEQLLTLAALRRRRPGTVAEARLPPAEGWADAPPPLKARWRGIIGLDGDAQ